MTDAPAFTVSQLAERWQCSERHVYDLLAQGEVGHMKLRTLIRIRREDVEAYEAKSWHAPKSSTQNAASSSVEVVPISDNGRKLRESAFRRGQRIAREMLDKGKP